MGLRTNQNQNYLHIYSISFVHIQTQYSHRYFLICYIYMVMIDYFCHHYAYSSSLFTVFSSVSQPMYVWRVFSWNLSMSYVFNMTNIYTRCIYVCNVCIVANIIYVYILSLFFYSSDTCGKFILEAHLEYFGMIMLRKNKVTYAFQQ
jgi:hypothetical protein